MTAAENPVDPGAHEAPAPATLEQLHESYRSLRALLLIALVCLLILTGSLFVFLLREVSATRQQVKELTQYVASYEKNSVPVMRQFRDKLIEFAKSNQDFAPILSKYVNPTNYTRLSPAPGPAQSPQSVAPARAPVAPPK